MNYKITIGTVCFIKNELEQKILLLERLRSPMQNLWTGVGGKTNFDEDIAQSCIREIQEETGLIVPSVNLRGVIKTILSGQQSSWILFVYTVTDFSGDLCACDEGNLSWVPYDKVKDKNIIGFIRKIIPDLIENNNSFIEGTIVHDEKGVVISANLKEYTSDVVAISAKRSLEDLQNKIRDFSAAYNINRSPLESRMLDLVSEVGELAKEILKGTSYGVSPFNMTQNFYTELGDVFFSLIMVANSGNVDLSDALQFVLKKYEQRVNKTGFLGSDGE